MIDETSRIGAHHAQVAFIHPKSGGGVLYEFVKDQNEGEKLQ